MVFQNSKPHLQHAAIFLAMQPIKQVCSTTFLGVEIDSKLTWKHHIRNVEKKIASSLFLLRKIRYKINEKTALMLYDALMLSHLSYCNIIWANTCKTYLKPLNKLQKQCIRACLSPKTRSDSASLFTISNKLKCTDIYKLQLAKIVYAYKFLNSPNSLPIYIGPVARAGPLRPILE